MFFSENSNESDPMTVQRLQSYPKLQAFPNYIIGEARQLNQAIQDYFLNTHESEEAKTFRTARFFTHPDTLQIIWTL